TFVKPGPNPPLLQSYPIPPALFERPTKPHVAYSSGSPPTLEKTSKPHVYPYLVDEFFYTAQTEPMVYMADDGASGTVPPGQRLKFPGDLTNPAQAYYGVWPNPKDGPAPIKTDPVYYQPAGTTSYYNFPIKTSDAVGTTPVQYYRYSPTPLN